MSIANARQALESERKGLQAQIAMIDRALAVLAGDPKKSGAQSQGDGRRKAGGKRSKPKKTSRADLTQEQALDRYGAEALTCTVCGRVSRAPQGMKAHMRSHNS